MNECIVKSKQDSLNNEIIKKDLGDLVPSNPNHRREHQGYSHKKYMSHPFD